jgi:membrane-associated phospholipid phosphatase
MNGVHLRPGRPLLGASVRYRAGWLLACCAVLVAAGGVLFAHKTRADWFDHAIDSPVISGLGSHYHLLLWLAAAGTTVPAVAASAAIVIACLLTGRLNGALLGAAAVLVATRLDDGLLKSLVHRTYLGALSYPSGHTTTVFALAATLTVLLAIPPQPARTRVPRMLLLAAAYLVAVIVVVAVIGLQWHYFTDTVAGAAVGIGTVCGLALILDLPVVRRWLARVSGQRDDLAAAPALGAGKR